MDSHTIILEGTLAYTFLAISAISAVVGAVATYQQGKANARVADMNADLANQEARQQLAIAKVQEQMQINQALADRAAANAEAAIARANASAIDNETLAEEARSREEIRRKREESRIKVAEQGAVFAASGVVGTTGTPLAVLAETVMMEESSAIDTQYLANVNSTKTRFEAALERSKAGNIEGAAAAQFALSVNAAKVSGLSAQIGARNKMSQAEIDREAGKLAKKQATISAIAQGVGGVSNSYYGYKSTR
jgi:hypothetical protein